MNEHGGEEEICGGALQWHVPPEFLLSAASQRRDLYAVYQLLPQLRCPGSYNTAKERCVRQDFRYAFSIAYRCDRYDIMASILCETVRPCKCFRKTSQAILDDFHVWCRVCCEKGLAKDRLVVLLRAANDALLIPGILRRDECELLRVAYIHGHQEVIDMLLSQHPGGGRLTSEDANIAQ